MNYNIEILEIVGRIKKSREPKQSFISGHGSVVYGSYSNVIGSSTSYACGSYSNVIGTKSYASGVSNMNYQGYNPPINNSLEDLVRNFKYRRYDINLKRLFSILSLTPEEFLNMKYPSIFRRIKNYIKTLFN
jgi:hypothetical protein